MGDHMQSGRVLKRDRNEQVARSILVQAICNNLSRDVHTSAFRADESANYVGVQRHVTGFSDRRDWFSRAIGSDRSEQITGTTGSSESLSQRWKGMQQQCWVIKQSN